MSYKLAALALLAFSVEIVMRRWYWHQLPTQVPAILVYSVVLVNLTLALRWLGQKRTACAS